MDLKSSNFFEFEFCFRDPYTPREDSIIELGTSGLGSQRTTDMTPGNQNGS